MMNFRNNSSNEPKVSFARDLGLFDATMIGIGAKIIILGVFIFYGLRQILGHPLQAAENFRPFMPRGATVDWRAGSRCAWGPMKSLVKKILG